MKPTEYMEREIAMADLFGKKLAVPVTEDEHMEWILRVYADLSPENLTCDGELSRAQVVKKQKGLLKTLVALEESLGRKVPEEEAYEWYEKKEKTK